MNKKIRVGILFGGKSVEHEVSLLSAKNVIRGLDKDKYEVILICIDREGKWHLKEEGSFLSSDIESKALSFQQEEEKIVLVEAAEERKLIGLSKTIFSKPFDVIFPILHGAHGEDGTIQGFLKLFDIPFVGSSVLSSAVCMDKDIAKRLFRDADIPTARFLTFRKSSSQKPTFEEMRQTFGVPFFVKPANLGSSVGISKVKEEKDFLKAIEEAFSYDHKILVEEYIAGREIECSVLGNETPIASIPGEIIPSHEFYSYEAKYIDEKGASLKIPADLSLEIQKQVQELSIKAYQTLDCEGMARVDFFLKEDGELFINEINTIPGFTNISMYPKLWEVSGIPCQELLDRLISLAVERFEGEKQLIHKKVNN